MVLATGTSRGVGLYMTVAAMIFGFCAVVYLLVSANVKDTKRFAKRRQTGRAGGDDPPAAED